MPDSNAFREKVQGRIQEFLARSKDRSRGEVFCEGIVEGVELYRMFLEEQREEKDGKDPKAEKKRRVRDKDGHSSKPHKERHRHEHRRKKHSGHDEKSPGRHRRRSHPKDGEEVKEKHRKRSRSCHKDKSSRKHRNQSPQNEPSISREVDDDSLDPLTEGSPENDTQYLMTGGAGPPGTLPTSSPHPREISPLPSRQESGPGQLPLRELPKFKRKKGLAFGFGDHLVNVYKHVTAEQNAGIRSRGFLEKKKSDRAKAGKEEQEKTTPAVENRDKIRSPKEDRGRAKGHRR